MTDPNMDVLRESGWEVLGMEARKTESDLDVKLSSYAELGARFPQGGTAGSLSPRIQLMQERAAIHGSITHIDNVKSLAKSARANLRLQRALFDKVQRKLNLLSDKFPIIHVLLGSIRRQKSRDTLILSAVIAACTLFIIIFWLSK